MFIHIPKTAGTSIEHYFLGLRGLSPAEGGALALFRNPLPSRLERAHGRCSLEMYENLVFGGTIPADFRIFAVVRDPLARFLSEWRYRRLPGRSRWGVRPPLWLLAAAAQDTQGVLAGRLKDLCAHLRPQCDDLTGRAAGLVRLLRLERLAEDFVLLQKDWGPAKLADSPGKRLVCAAADGGAGRAGGRAGRAGL